MDTVLNPSVSFNEKSCYRRGGICTYLPGHRDSNGKSDYEYDIDAWEKDGRGGNPEVSNTKGKKGIVVDYEDSFSPSKKNTGSTLYINHGAGHSSKEGDKHENDGIMADGDKLQHEYTRYGYKFFFSPNTIRDISKECKSGIPHQKQKINIRKRRKNDNQGVQGSMFIC